MNRDFKVARPASLVLGIVALPFLSCSSDYDYTRIATDLVDIHEVVECEFEPTEAGWESYTCVPVFSTKDDGAQPWEAGSIGGFDILEQRIFGAPFYQLFYSGSVDSSGSDVGYAVSMDGVDWRRHPYNPVVRRDKGPGAFDRDDVTVACAAFDGDLGIYHLWYTGTNSERRGTLFGHATSTDGVAWTKDLFNPIDPLESSNSPLDRVWGCDALYEDGKLHFWVSGVNHVEASIISQQEWLESTVYDVAYLSTTDGTRFDGEGGLILQHQGLEGEEFDAEGVHAPSVFSYSDGDTGELSYYMLYSGYHRVTAVQDPSSDLVWINKEGLRLGMASSSSPDAEWTRLLDGPVPLDFSGEEQAENPRAFFINGRLHVFFNDVFTDELGDTISGIGLGISPFPVGQEGS